MATAVRFRPLVPALLAVCSFTPCLRADDLPSLPQLPPLSSIGELFALSPRLATLPARPEPVPAARPLDASRTSQTDPRGSNLVATMKPGDQERRKLKKNDELEWGFVTTELIWRAPEPGRDTPFERGEWSTEDLVAVPMLGPFYVFGGVEMGGDYAADQTMKLVGRTGLLWKMPVGDSSAIEVRGGPTVKYNDALNLEKARDQGAMLWEVKAKAPLLGPVGLEYLGEAQPGVTAVDRSQVNSDVALFLPVSGGKLKLGAKHRWEEGKQEARSSSNFMQWYLGIEIGR